MKEFKVEMHVNGEEKRIKVEGKMCSLASGEKIYLEGASVGEYKVYLVWRKEEGKWTNLIKEYLKGCDFKVEKEEKIYEEGSYSIFKKTASFRKFSDSKGSLEKLSESLELILKDGWGAWEEVLKEEVKKSKAVSEDAHYCLEWEGGDIYVFPGGTWIARIESSIGSGNSQKVVSLLEEVLAKKRPVEDLIGMLKDQVLEQVREKEERMKEVEHIDLKQRLRNR